MSTTVATLLTLVSQRLLETDATFPSRLWDRDEIITYLNDAQNDFVVRTGIVKSVGAIRAIAGNTTYEDPTYAVDVERISWNGKKLYPQSRQELDWQKPTWRRDTARNPRRYHRDNLPAHEFEVWPAPDTAGLGYTTTGTTTGIIRGLSGSRTYNVTGTFGTIRTIRGQNYFVGAQPGISGGNEAIGIPRQMMTGSTNFFFIHDALPGELLSDGDTLLVPDAFSRHILYGTLAKAWAKEGDGQDIARSRYCQLRFERGVELARRLVFGAEEV